jgi:peptidoglycan glycosyltransferase
VFVSTYGPQIRRLALVWLTAFVILALAAGYWQVVAAPHLQANPNNSRAALRLSLTEPGNIYAADGTTVVLGSRREQGVWRASYPEPETFCHLTGYNERTGLQRTLREPLLGVGRYANPWHLLRRGRSRGCDVKLTIHAEAQRLATRMLRGRRGAVVAIDPQDGALQVLVSAPAYDPTVLASVEAFEVFRTDPFSPELCRALQGLYTPGSVLKIATAAIALETHTFAPEDEFTCSGDERVAGTRVACPRAHGKLSLTDALAQSCNITFATVGAKIGAEAYRDYMRRFHLLDDPLLQLPGKPGRMSDLLGSKGTQFLVHTAYGQGQTMVTPLALARLTATFARGGVVPKPYLVAEILNADGHVISAARPQEAGRAISVATAAQVAGMMSAAVEQGTAGVMQIPGVSVAAKTGTAQKAQGKPDVWMLAYAPVEHPTTAVAVVVEGGESGAETAGPLAREVLRLLLGG